MLITRLIVTFSVQGILCEPIQFIIKGYLHSKLFCDRIAPSAIVSSSPGASPTASSSASPSTTRRIPRRHSPSRPQTILLHPSSPTYAPPSSPLEVPSSKSSPSGTLQSSSTDDIDSKEPRQRRHQTMPPELQLLHIVVYRRRLPQSSRAGAPPSS